jgi:hypothetical protein
MNGIPRPKKCVYCLKNDGKTTFVVGIGWVHVPKCKDIGTRAIRHYILDASENKLLWFCQAVLQVTEDDKKEQKS